MYVWLYKWEYYDDSTRHLINPLGGINLIEVAVDNENKCKDGLPHADRGNKDA